MNSKPSNSRRRASPSTAKKLVKALHDVITYAEAEAIGLDSETRNPQARKKAAAAWKAIAAARAAIAEATTAESLTRGAAHDPKHRP
jgi:hypothetical protein